MADKKKKSQAEKAAAASRSKTKRTAKLKSESAGKKQTGVPLRFISSAVFLGCFILFLVIFFRPEGTLVKMIGNIVRGIIGEVGFIISIPVLLYLFIIHAFSGKRPAIMRSVCLGGFVLICGCIAHLSYGQTELPSGFELVRELYFGGISGTTGGILCGSIAMFLHWLCGTVISYILLGIGALLTLLGGMQITVPSILRAIANRPRLQQQEETVEEERPEPASVVVNHFANKRIEYINNQRARAAEKEETVRKPQTPEEKASELMHQIRSDTQMPVAAAGTPASEPHFADPDPEIIPQKMPELRQEKPHTVEVKVKKVTAKETEQSAEAVSKEIEKVQEEKKPAYCFPPIDLLKSGDSGVQDSTNEMRENSRRLNETLASFHIEAHIINVTRGPSVTRYEVELERGVRLNKLTTAADDIALSLGALGVRIAAVPGKISVVGIEVPNRSVTMVPLREVIDSQEFRTAKSHSAFSVGKDIDGNCIVGNIAKLPHMLIAGTTGSGKSVCMNSIIISLLYKASPEDVKLIMVDPKMVELGIYNGIPHLLIPVVTDPKKAAGSLQWAVTEMMRRYKIMSDAGVRDLESYNGIVESQETDAKKLPQIVVIIDELADLMLVAAKEVEESICRIAQMGRAAGIHLLIATQRPSADVITGLMKANIPSRIAFAVASAMESRIILDTQGAEKLVGKGDMLYAPFGNGKPRRVQGCFVSDSEVEAVATYVKSGSETNYDQQVIEEIDRKAAQTGNKNAPADADTAEDDGDGDEMLPAAVDVIMETGQASVSMLQRRLKLGYARAARIVDEMEARGIVGPFQGSKPRAILLSKEEWSEMRGGADTQMDFSDLEQDDTDEYSEQ